MNLQSLSTCFRHNQKKYSECCDKILMSFTKVILSCQHSNNNCDNLIWCFSCKACKASQDRELCVFEKLNIIGRQIKIYLNINKVWNNRVLFYTSCYKCFYWMHIWVKMLINDNLWSVIVRHNQKKYSECCDKILMSFTKVILSCQHSNNNCDN